jgi:hypothetical protein
MENAVNIVHRSTADHPAAPAPHFFADPEPILTPRNEIFPVQSSRGMIFSTARAPGTRQLLLTLFLWVTVRINRKAARIYMQLSDKAVDYRSIMPVPAL